jgi:DNA replicative helicase MCM subunit Mcm2 (Cdc46/Mcm family)
MLDEKDPEHDRKIAERVIMNHRYMSNNNDNQMHNFNYFNDDVVIEPEHKDDNQNENGKQTQVYEKILTSNKKDAKNTVTREFLKKYISLAKAQKAPELV